MPLLRNVMRGLLLGFVIVMPGMSGGTALVILGLYGKIISDLSRLKIIPHLPLIIGLFFGIYLGGVAFARLLIFYRDVTAAFFLGVILVSVRVIIKGRPAFNPYNMVALLGGFVAGYFMAGEPLGIVERATADPFLLFSGGAISSAAMLIPGVPGSAVLIVMGIYDDMLFLVNNLVVFPLAIFACGGFVGIVILARIMAKYYEQHQDFLSFLFAGLIGGSLRILLPQTINISVVIALFVGGLLVWYWGEKNLEAR